MLIKRLPSFLSQTKKNFSFNAGFTLIELMVTIAVAAILATIAVPSFNDVILSSRLAGFANTFIASIQLARSEAIKRNSTVNLCRSATGTSCANAGGWEQGWIVFHDINSDGNADVGETIIQYQQALSSGYQLKGNGYSITFSSIGVGVTPVILKLCRATPSVGSQEKEINVGATGRSKITTTRSGTCS